MVFVQPRSLVGASSGYRYAFKAMLSTSFFCGYGPACIFWKLCFVIVPCSVSVDMVLHSFSLEIVFSDCSNSSMEFYRTSLCERHSTASSTKESLGRSLK